MNKITYLKAALKEGLFKRKAWLISILSIIQENVKEYENHPYPYRIVQSPTGIYFVSPEDPNTLIKIEDAAPNIPLFTFKDKITADNSDCINLIEPIETTIGQLLFNLIVMVNSFDNKFPFVSGKVNIRDIENTIASKLLDTPLDNKEKTNINFYVDEYVKFADSLSFIGGLTQLCVWAATEKVITPPTGIKEFKAELIKKYGDTLSDPVQLSLFEKELKEFDEKYLTGDPSNNTFLSGKSKGISRKKLFLTFGAEAGFSDSLELTPVTNSLNEGWPTDPVEFSAMLNASRAGSFSRGSETVKGGVSAKVLLRSAGNVKITDNDCQTELGIHRYFVNSDIQQLVGRSIKTTKGWLPIVTTEEAQKYLNQNLIVRSPMYCILDGDNICKECAGKKLAQNPVGVAMALTEISSIILTTSMKAMHGKILATAPMKLNSTFS